MSKLEWWQKAVFYQVYPRSFADGNGDGIGDFRGIVSRLDYLQELGIDAIWLSPHYPSPQFDCGYDVADYTAVDPEYGTLANFRTFLEGAHNRRIRVILDLVLNHTSDQHPWFVESRSSFDNPKREWYIWLDGRGEGPPNNWNSGFGGSAWEYDPGTNQYYYHYFFRQQPDLNWRNPEVKRAMFDTVRFWLDLGVDGFRLDAIDSIFEHACFPDNSTDLSEDVLLSNALVPGNADGHRSVREQWNDRFRNRQDQYQKNQLGLHELMRELRALIDEYPDRVLVGETQDIAYYGDGSNELHMVFNFPLMRTRRLTPSWIRDNQSERLAALPPKAWPCNTLGNHDTPRVYSRFGDGRHDDAIARLSLALMLTLRGTPFLYNGEEIGMRDLDLEHITQFRDMLGVWYYSTMTERGVGPNEALVYANRVGRDKCRTPMQWTNQANGGFCPRGTQPWLPVNSNYATGINVADQQADSMSLFRFYQKMLSIRKKTPALLEGDYRPLHEEAEDYLAFLRSSPDSGHTCLVVLNMSEQSRRLTLNLEASQPHLLYSNHNRVREVNLSQLPIHPFEVFIAELK